MSRFSLRVLPNDYMPRCLLSRPLRVSVRGLRFVTLRVPVFVSFEAEGLAGVAWLDTSTLFTISYVDTGEQMGSELWHPTCSYVDARVSLCADSCRKSGSLIASLPSPS